MAAFANLSLNDGQATPVAHTFQTSKRYMDARGRNAFDWLDFSVNGGVPVGANSLQLWVMPMAVGNGRNAGDVAQVTEGLLRVVTMETLGNNTVSGVNPQPRFAFSEDLWWKHRRNGRSDQAKSKDVHAFLASLLASTLYKDITNSLQLPT